MKERDAHRLYYLDTIRIVLAILVILCHVALAYSPTVWWLYKSENARTQMLYFYQIVAPICMCTFFFIFGYFLLPSLNKKGIKKFLKDKVIQYSLPIAILFPLVIMPLSYLYHLTNRAIGYTNYGDYIINIFFGVNGEPDNWTDKYWAIFPDLKMPYLWFLEHCLIYSIIFVFFYVLIKGKGIYSCLRNQLKPILSASFICLVLATYWLRTIYPLDYWEGVLGFIQTEFANVMKYVAAVVLGIIANKEGWLLSKTVERRDYLFFISTSLILSIVIAGDSIPLVFTSGEKGLGTFLWTIFDIVLTFCFIQGILSVSQRYGNKKILFLSLLGEATFGVYLLHVPVLVIIQYLSDSIRLNLYLKAVIQGIVAIIITFASVLIYYKVKRKILSKNSNRLDNSNC